MQGLSARSMVISWVCRLIITLYLLDTRETSYLILFEICLDLFLSTWKLTKAIDIKFSRNFKPLDELENSTVTTTEDSISTKTNQEDCVVLEDSFPNKVKFHIKRILFFINPKRFIQKIQL